MKLLLVRHGESRGNLDRRWQGWLDEPLTELGHEQARRLAERLYRRSLESLDPITAVYTSTLTRAYQTANIVALRCGVPLILDQRLRERDVGVLQGLTWPEVEAHHPTLAHTIRQNWTVPALPEGETTFELTERVWYAVQEIIGRENGRGDPNTVAIVSHGGTINAFLNRLVGRNHEMPFMFSFGNTSLSMVEIRDGRPRILLVNDLCHLDGTKRS
jgi:broad specificity phosphatase PhoE